MSLIRCLFRTARRPAPAARPRLHVERLAERALPSAAPHGLHLPGHSALGRGLPTEAVQVADYDGDGSPDALYRQATRYNARGQVLEVRYASDVDTDGTPEYQQTTQYRYDARNRMVGETTVFQDASGYASRSDASYTNDARGNLVVARQAFDNGLDGTVDEVYTTTNTYDTRGNILTSRFAGDFGNDGSVEWQELWTFTYDGRGNWTGYHVNSLAPDGSVIDTLDGANTYDGRGRLLSEVQTYDQGNDGTVDDTFTQTNTYDARGNLASLSLRSESALFGTSATTSAYTYDNQGNRLTERAVYDWGGDGVIDSVSVSSLAYDSRGNLVSVSTASDWDGDGVIDSRSTETVTY